MVSLAVAFSVRMNTYLAFAPGSPLIAVPEVALEPLAWNCIASISAAIISPVPLLKVIFEVLDLPVKVTVPPSLSTAGLVLSNWINSAAGRWLATNCFFSATPVPSTSNVALWATRVPRLATSAFTCKVVSPEPDEGLTTMPFCFTSAIFLFIYLGLTLNVVLVFTVVSSS